MKIAALATELHGSILRDAAASTCQKTAALIRRCKATDAYEKERKLILKELSNVALAAGSPPCLFLLAQEWADDALTVLLEILARKRTAQAVQEKYFDGHGILNPGFDTLLEATIQMLLETVATFNEYVSSKQIENDEDLEQQGQSADKCLSLP